MIVSVCSCWTSVIEHSYYVIILHTVEHQTSLYFERIERCLVFCLLLRKTIGSLERFRALEINALSVWAEIGRLSFSFLSPRVGFLHPGEKIEKKVSIKATSHGTKLLVATLSHSNNYITVSKSYHKVSVRAPWLWIYFTNSTQIKMWMSKFT